MQGIGVRGALPDDVPVQGDNDELGWLSAANGTGWTWAALSEDWERDPERTAGEVATAAAGPALAFVIVDSDMAVLYGAAPGEPTVVASTGQYEIPGPPTQAAAFAAWSERFAPNPVSAERLDEWAQTWHVFAEEGLAYLLSQMGFVQAPSQPPETLDA
jgi:hypothetical protein